MAFSPDQGRTWSSTELAFPDSAFDLALLPDGGLAVGLSGLKTRPFSYDGGHRWSREVSTYTDSYTRFACCPMELRSPMADGAARREVFTAASRLWTDDGHEAAPDIAGCVRLADSRMPDG